MKKLLPLVSSTIEREEIDEAKAVLDSGRLTMGKKVEQFEKDFSRYLDIKHSVMVNSGSSANLLAMQILANPSLKDPIKPGNEVIVPAVTWSTSIFPILDIGAKPFLVDVDIMSYLMNIERIKEAINEKTKAIMAVHLLGNAIDMKAIKDLAEDHKLYIIEDCCEAMGTELNGKKVGTFGDISTFSTYFSHHITTMEGGLLCTNEDSYADLAMIMRSHGYVRHSLYKDLHIKDNEGIDPRFLFVNKGYNFRPTEIQGAFGIHQIRKLEMFIKHRRASAHALKERLAKYKDYLQLPYEMGNIRHSYFAFPITVLPNNLFGRNELMRYLEEKGIETRPLVAGNFAEQPAMKLFKYNKNILMIDSESIMRRSFYIGMHHNISDLTIEEIGLVFDDFFDKVGARL